MMNSTENQIARTLKKVADEYQEVCGRKPSSDEINKYIEIALNSKLGTDVEFKKRANEEFRVVDGEVSSFKLTLANKRV